MKYGEIIYGDIFFFEVTFPHFFLREENMGISVLNLSEEQKSIPNPVRTFAEAFEKYRE